MAPIELEANCDLDVTIYLMEKLSMIKQEADSAGNKRRRISAQESESAQGATLGQVKVRASRLRQCSTYFDTCMSERWAQSKVTNKEMEFHLEVHTEVRYYEDCFSRMNYLHNRIGSVACCIELLKVASQIGFQALVDIGVKCLGGTDWSDEDEKLVREFCTSGNLVPLDSLTDLLTARFHYLPLTQEEQQEKISLNARDLFSCYLRNALPEESPVERADFESRRRSRTKFQLAFNVVMSGVESGVVCDKVVEHVQALLTKALANLLACAQRELGDLPARASAVESVLSDICWLFEVAREANAAQALLVILLGEDLGISRMLGSAVSEGGRFSLKPMQLKKWAAIIYALFQDVLEGKLFLNSFERSTLFNSWRWLLRDKILGLDHEHVNAVRVRFLTTLPQTEQEKFWMKAEIPQHGRGILVETHRAWISRMVSRKVQLLQPQSTASSNEVRSKTQD